MNTTGRIANITTDYQTGKRLLTFSVDSVPDDELDRLAKAEKLRVSAVKYYDKRSLDANGYFYKLINLIAQKQKYTSDAYLHDKFLSENRAYVYDESGMYCYLMTNETPNDFGMIKHRKPDKNYEYWIDSGMVVCPTFADGNKKGQPLTNKATGEAEMLHIFWRIKGTHEMDSKEMSRIIDSVVYEAKELGIETMPPKELERLLAEWEGKKVFYEQGNFDGEINERPGRKSEHKR